MKPRIQAHVMLAAVAALTACRSKSATENVEAPYAYRAGAGQEQVTQGAGPATDSVTFERGGVPTLIARNEVQGALGLTALGTLVSAFVTNGQTLEVAMTPEVNAAAIAASLKAKICRSGVVTYTNGSAAVVVDFGAGCALAGSNLVVTGTVFVGVTAGTSGVPWMAVEVTLGKVGLDGYLVDGHATISTDGFKETFDTRLSLANFGIVTFRGAMERDGATVTLDGVGSWRGTELSTPPTSDGWRCVSAPQSALSFRKVHRTTSDCYGDRGMLVVTRPYACVGEDDAGAPARSNLVATSNVVFLPTTPATGNVTISVSLPGGAADVSAAPAATPLPAQVCQSRGKGAG